MSDLSTNFMSLSTPNISVKRQPSKEIRLHKNTKERDHVTRLADLYSIFKTTELLEAAFIRDVISPTDYTEASNRLISQFKATEKSLLISGTIQDIQSFYKEHVIDCPHAYERLIVSGIPATILHPVVNTNKSESVSIAETVQAFITTMDALRLGQKAVDEISPLVTEILASLGKIQSLPPNFEGVIKMEKWTKQLNSMRAVEELSEDDVRQLLFDLDSSYSSFHKHLSN